MLPANSRLIVRCRISRGGFSSERVFRVTLANKEQHIGAAPVEYFLTEKQSRLAPDQAPERGIQIKGFIEARLIRNEPGGGMLAERGITPSASIKRGSSR
jgi:hypothetical protein